MVSCRRCVSYGGGDGGASYNGGGGVKAQGTSDGGKQVYSDSGMDVCTGGNKYLDMVCGYRVRGG